MTEATHGSAALSADMAYGLAGLTAPAPAEPAKPAGVRWLTDKKRITSHTMEHPFELDGVTYETITIKRLSAREVAAVLEKMRAAEGPTRFPFYYVGDIEVSDAAWDAMDDDDRFALGEIASDFLPARFRPDPASD